MKIDEKDKKTLGRWLIEGKRGNNPAHAVRDNINMVLNKYNIKVSLKSIEHNLLLAILISEPVTHTETNIIEGLVDNILKSN